MHDAQNLFDDKTAYSGEWNVDEKLDSLQAELIVIGIEHGNDKRISELTPYKYEKYGGGDADNYVDFIVHTLKPRIDSMYRTKANRKNTLMMGSSLGGLVTLYSGIKYPNVFGKIAVFSPSLWFSKKIFKAVSFSKKIPEKLYLLCGDNEDEAMITEIDKLESTLITDTKIKSKNLKKVVIKKGQQNEKLWRDHFVDAILWLDY
ncbi:alpha/beta hydrolase [Flavobacterium frigidarium]|uniref:alpha/beta hydrolase n=1 Tax=Flavobacterium frigidarium TaxID=99286 RepID=UPI000413B355